MCFTFSFFRSDKEKKIILYSNSLIYLKDIFSKDIVWLSVTSPPNTYLWKLFSAWCVLAQCAAPLAVLRVAAPSESLTWVCSVPRSISPQVSLFNSNRWCHPTSGTRPHSSLLLLNSVLLTLSVTFHVNPGALCFKVQKPPWFWTWALSRCMIPRAADTSERSVPTWGFLYHYPFTQGPAATTTFWSKKLGQI